MGLRNIDPKMWKDSWFLDLAPNEKLLFIYLFTNGRTAWPGIYDVNPYEITCDTGISHSEIIAALDKFTAAGKITHDEWTLTITNYTKYQHQQTTYCPGNVYLIHDPRTGLFKIGISKNMKMRMGQLKHRYGTQLRLVNKWFTTSMRWIETCLHSRFSERRVRGEWFDLADDDLTWLMIFDPAEIAP